MCGARDSHLYPALPGLCAPLGKGITLAMHWARSRLRIPELREPLRHVARIRQYFG